MPKMRPTTVVVALLMLLGLVVLGAAIALALMPVDVFIHSSGPTPAHLTTNT